MAHADVCPCKHFRFVCRGACPDCMVNQYGPAGASEILRRDGEAPECPPGYDMWQKDHRESESLRASSQHPEGNDAREVER